MPTQEEIGEHLDMTDRNFREIRDKLADRLGIDPERASWWQDTSMDLIRVEYIRYMREMASGRGGDQQYDLTRERAELTRELKLKARRENEEAEEVVRHVDVITEVLAQVSVKVAAAFDAILPKIKRQYGDLPPKAVEIIEKTVSDARNEVHGIELDWESFDEMEEAARSGEEGARPPESARADAAISLGE